MPGLVLPTQEIISPFFQCGLIPKVKSFTSHITKIDIPLICILEQ